MQFFEQYMTEVLGVSHIITPGVPQPEEASVDVVTKPAMGAAKINPAANILFLVPEEKTKQEIEVLHNISKACAPKPLIVVTKKQLSDPSYLEALKSSNISHGLCFGSEGFDQLSKSESFFDYFKNYYNYGGLNWLATHSLEKLSDKSSDKLQAYKKETWMQIKKIFGDLKK